MVREKPNVPYPPGLQVAPAPKPEWQGLTLPEIIQAMKRLGWRPRLTSLEVSFALASAADSLAKIAARARQLARAHPELTADLVAFSRQAARQAERLKDVRRELVKL